MKQTTVKVTNSFPWCMVLFIAFLVMKLAQVGLVADWSWWWVTAPLWMPMAIVIAACGVFAVFFVVAVLIDRVTAALRRRKFKRRGRN